MKLYKSRELFHYSQQIIPGGVNSPVRAFNAVGGVPPFIKRANGAHVWDMDDNQYIDYVGSWGPMILGHAHPNVISAVQEAIDDGLSYGAPTEKEMILAKMVIDRVPGCEMVRLVNSGTEATMSVIRLARGITGKDKIIKFSGCYHGHADSFLIQSGSGALTFGEPNSPGVTQGTAQDTLIAQFNDIQTVEDHFMSHGSEIACVILEPINGNTGCILPKDGFLQDLRVLCNDHDALLIFDEVMTGFRVSRGGAAEYYSVLPDLYTFGKIIGGGLPIGAYAGRKEFMEQMSPVGSIYQAGTLSGNPIAVSAGIATLELLNDKTYDELEILGKYFQDSLQVLIDENEFGHLLSQERVGSMFSVFFHPGPIQNINDVMNCDFKLFAKYFNGLLNKGIYIAPSQHEVGFLSIAHTRSMLDSTILVINSVLNEIMVLA